MADEQPTIPSADQVAAGRPKRDDTTFYATGIVSGTSGQPLVDLRWGESHGLLDPHELAEHVKMLMREAWWADSDAALLSFLVTQKAQSVEKAGAFLLEFRAHRLRQLDYAAMEKAKGMRAAYDAESRAELERRRAAEAQRRGGDVQ